MTESILQEAERLTNGDRQAQYGPPDQDFRRTADMWTAIWRHKLLPGESFSTIDVAIAMILLKCSRQTHQQKRDNWTDIAGYANCGQKCAEAIEESPSIVGFSCSDPFEGHDNLVFNLTPQAEILMSEEIVSGTLSMEDFVDEAMEETYEDAVYDEDSWFEATNEVVNEEPPKYWLAMHRKPGNSKLQYGVADLLGRLADFGSWAQVANSAVTDLKSGRRQECDFNWTPAGEWKEVK